MGILYLFAFLVLIPITSMLVGLIMAFDADPTKSKKGKKYLLVGFLILLVEILIGFAVCSNMRFN